jgi:hypothetical protein
MSFFRRWNFIERARLERELWDAFERGENLDTLVENCRQKAQTGLGGASFRLEVWETTLSRIRRIETMMKDQPRPQD